MLRSHSVKTIDFAAILCVEDNETHLRLGKAVLADAGYAVFSALTPSEAMEVLHKVPVCLILSDRRLRGTAGTVLAKEMRRAKPDVPILLYSGDAPEGMESVDGYINKNEPVTRFLAMIRDFTRRSRDQRLCNHRKAG